MQTIKTKKDMKTKNNFFLLMILLCSILFTACDKNYYYEEIYYPENGNGNNGGNNNGGDDNGDDNGNNGDNGGTGGDNGNNGGNGNDGDDGQEGIIEFKDVYLNAEFTNEVWDYAEDIDNYLILGVDNAPNRFVIIDVRDDNYHNSKPSAWIENLNDLDKTGAEIDLLNQTSGYTFSKDVVPCVYKSCFYWKSKSNAPKIDALISRYVNKAPFIITNGQWYKANVKYQFINKKSIKVWSFSGKSFIIRLIPEI